MNAASECGAGSPWVPLTTQHGRCSRKLPPVTVVIPAYNSATTILDSLESIKRQSWPVQEVIVVDDASADDTAEVVEKWLLVNGCSLSEAGKDPVAGYPLSVIGKTNNLQPMTDNCDASANNHSTSWRILRQPRNMGPSAARNCGVEEAKGEWIAFLDSDDACLPDRIETQSTAVAEHPDGCLFCGGKIGFGQQYHVTGPRTAARKVELIEFVSGNPVGTSTVLVKKAAFFEVGGFDPRFRYAEDYDLWMRIAAQHPIYLLDVPFVRYRERRESLSMDDQKFLPGAMRVLDRAFSPGGALYVHRRLRRRAVANQYYSASWMAFWRGARWRALWFLWKACILYPPVGKSNKIRLWCRYLAGSFPGGR